jgi:AcrR family transcriptional regulator
MARTQEQRKAETRARLLAAAADLFARQGFHATSTDAVADAAGRTSGAVYAHFGGKEGLLLALLDEWEHKVAVRMGEALVSSEPGRARYETIWDHFAYAGDHAPELVAEEGADAADTWLLLEHELLLQAARNPDVGRVLGRRFAHARRGMGEAFARWADEEGGDLPLAGTDVATLVLALLLGLEMQRRLDPEAVPDRLAADGLALLIGTHDRVPAS